MPRTGISAGRRTLDAPSATSLKITDTAQRGAPALGAGNGYDFSRTRQGLTSAIGRRTLSATLLEIERDRVPCVIAGSSASWYALSRPVQHWVAIVLARGKAEAVG